MYVTRVDDTYEDIHLGCLYWSAPPGIRDHRLESGTPERGTVLGTRLSWYVQQWGSGRGVWGLMALGGFATLVPKLDGLGPWTMHLGIANMSKKNYKNG